MTGIRRTLILSGQTATAIVGASVPASAAPRTAADVLTTSSTVDADNLASQPRLSVTTPTTYGWTGSAPQTAVVSC